MISAAAQVRRRFPCDDSFIARHQRMRLNQRMRVIRTRSVASSRCKFMGFEFAMPPLSDQLPPSAYPLPHWALSTLRRPVSLQRATARSGTSAAPPYTSLRPTQQGAGGAPRRAARRAHNRWLCLRSLATRSTRLHPHFSESLGASRQQAHDSLVSARGEAPPGRYGGRREAWSRTPAHGHGSPFSSRLSRQAPAGPHLSYTVTADEITGTAPALHGHGEPL